MRAPDYAEYLIGQGKTVKTVRDYQREVDLALRWFAAHRLDLASASPSDLVAYSETRPNTPAIRAHMRSALRHYWKWQRVDGWPDAIRVPTPGLMVCKALTPEDARAMVKTAVGWWREGTAVLAGAYLALRNEEIASMRWEGFDSNLDWYTLVGKGNRTRTLPVHPVMVAELRGRRNDSPYVFEGRFSGHVTHATIWNWTVMVAKEAGVTEHVWPHRLRHTALATANDNTGNLRAVQSFAGHSRPETTAGYTRTTARRLREVSDSLDYL
jgi:integrase